jgi:hypothetical protein
VPLTGEHKHGSLKDSHAKDFQGRATFYSKLLKNLHSAGEMEPPFKNKCRLTYNTANQPCFHNISKLRKRSDSIHRFRIKKEMAEHYRENHKFERCKSIPHQFAPIIKEENAEVTQKDVFEFRSQVDRIAKINFNIHPMLKSV